MYMYLNQCFVSDLLVEDWDVVGQVHVQHEALPHLLKDLQAAGVSGVVELEDGVAHLRLQLQERLERAAEVHGCVACRANGPLCTANRPLCTIRHTVYVGVYASTYMCILT